MSCPTNPCPCELSGDNLAAIVYGPQDLRLEDKKPRIPKDNEVLILVEAVGICHTDVTHVKRGTGTCIPLVVGHEAAGTIIAKGEHVRDLELGDRVAIEPGVPCGECEFCETERYNLCPDIEYGGIPPTDGYLCRTAIHDADFCHRIPCQMSFDEAVFAEPLSVVLSGCNKANVKPGQLVLIQGAGPLGLLTLALTKALGAKAIVTETLHERRIRLAKDMGADYTVKLGCISEFGARRQISKILGYQQPDVTFECSGSEEGVQIGMKLTRSGGTLILFGHMPEEMKLPLKAAMTREVDIKGVNRSANMFPEAIELMENGVVNVNLLITHHFRLEETIQAFHAIRNKTGDPIKVIIHPNPNWPTPTIVN